MATKRCENYSIENSQCKFNYTPMPFGFNKSDIIPKCDGLKTTADCCWYKGYYLDIAGNDSLLKKYRSRFQEKSSLPIKQDKTYYEKRAQKEIEARMKQWENMSQD